jgi:hypothetical protein
MAAHAARAEIGGRAAEKLSGKIKTLRFRQPIYGK